MKAFMICTVIAGVVSFGMFMQMANKGESRGFTSTSQSKSEPKPAVVRARFPDDLAPAAQAKPVAQAADYVPGPGPHKLAFMTPAGKLHPWHDDISTSWAADSVGETTLVVVVPSKQTKTLVQTVLYPNNEPTIYRYSYELEVSVVEAKTGKVLDNRVFRNLPRQIHALEAWETTSIGRVLSAASIFNWVAEKSKAGFPEEEFRAPVDFVVQ